ncbi:MAG: hypothetical protein PF484_00050 [Bacteroidales bacterium]|nr:hypothetical protein [Bacteroidales bacterium]
MERNETGAGTRLPSFFIVGYLYAFVKVGFSMLEVNCEQANRKHLKTICEGVYPKKLYQIFRQNLAALELANSMEDKEQKIPGTEMTLSDAIRQHEIGSDAGAFDAGCFVPLSDRGADNLKKYLLDEKLEYVPLPDE